MKLKSTLLLFLLIFLFVGCIEKAIKTEEVNLIGVKTEDLSIPEDFVFNTTRNVSVELSDSLLAGAGFVIYDKKNGNVLSEGKLDENGNYTTILVLENTIESIYVKSTYIGFVSVELDIINNTVVYNYVNKSAVKKDYSVPNPTAEKYGDYYYLGNPEIDYYRTGRPKFLLDQGDVFSKEMRNGINSIFQERNTMLEEGVRESLLSNNYDHDLTVSDDGEVFISFYSETENFKNSLGFFTYESKNPPQTKDEIGDITMVFPNCSYNVLNVGDKVKIGDFKKGTGIGFVLVLDGFAEAETSWHESWKNNGGYWYQVWNFVNKPWEIAKNNNEIIYSNPRFNQYEIKDCLGLYYRADDKVVVGFEDLRERPNQDNQEIVNYDFDDTVFVVTGNFDTFNYPIIDPEVEEEDIVDYYPTKEKFNTFVYEDKWPELGDFDLNDLIVDVNYKLTRNFKNEAKELLVKVNPIASGALYINGFAIVLDVEQDKIESITGQDITLGNTSMYSTGNKTAIVIFDSIKDQFPTFIGDLLNTVKSREEFVAENLTVTVKFKEGAVIKSPFPFNPFMFRKDGVEIHLINNEPTSEADLSLLGSIDDASNPSEGKYYASKNGLPWAIEIPNGFRYPSENSEITEVYFNFAKWAVSGGISYKDWYTVNNYPVSDFNFEKMYK